MMNNILKCILLLTVIIYLLVAFVLWDLDISRWEYGARVAFAVMVGAVSLLIVIVCNVSEEVDSMNQARRDRYNSVYKPHGKPPEPPSSRY